MRVLQHRFLHRGTPYLPGYSFIEIALKFPIRLPIKLQRD
jgi:hypothetical protein